MSPPIAYQRPSVGRTLRLVGRALRLRCPNCGGGGVIRGWVNMASECPTCGVRLEREHGYFLGAMVFNIGASELLYAALMVGILVATWPTPPWTFFQFGGVLLLLLFPLAFYPVAHTLWVALDWSVRPLAADADGLDHPWPGAPMPR